jgi:hypothetical protein
MGYCGVFELFPIFASLPARCKQPFSKNEYLCKAKVLQALAVIATIIIIIVTGEDGTTITKKGRSNSSKSNPKN